MVVSAAVFTVVISVVDLEQLSAAISAAMSAAISAAISAAMSMAISVMEVEQLFVVVSAAIL